MADLKSTRIFGWLKVLGDADVKGELKEKGQRVYSPNNPNITTSVTSTSSSLYASASAVKTAYDRGTSALNVANGKLGTGAKAADSDKLDGQHGSYYAKASQVLTNVPAGAKFTDTQVPLSSSVSSTSTSAAATSSAVKAAYDRGSSALSVANGKLAVGAKAVDSDKLDGQDSAYFAKASQVLTNVPSGAKFTDTQRPVIDSLTSTSKSASLTANQGRVLKGLVDNLSSLINSSDGSLDSLQEIVDFIKQNKDDLDSLTISNIAGLQTALNGKLGTGAKAVDSDKLDGQDSAYYAKASQVLTNVPAGAVFTDTQRAVSSTINSTSTSVAANSAAVKTAYDRGTSALNVANTKLGATAKAVDSDKLDGQHGSYYAKASQVLTNVPADAKFTDTNTWRSVSNSVTSTSTTVAATSKAAKTAYDRGSHALNVANGKLGATAKAVDSGKLNGAGSSSAATGNAVAVRDSAADIHARLFRSSYANQSNISGAMAFRISNGGDNYIRFCSSPTAIRAWLGVSAGAPPLKHYYTAGNVTVNLSHAMKHSITRWGTGNGTVTITGTGAPGTEVVINNIRTDSGTCTITGRKMYTGDGTHSESTHTITGQGSVTFVSYDGTSLMLASAIKGKVAQ